MTVRLLVEWTDPVSGLRYVPNNLLTVDAGTEAGLVTAKLASTNLTGGTTPTPPPVQAQRYPVAVTETGALVDSRGLPVAGDGGGTGGTVQIPYSTTIPLDADKVMPRTQIAGAVTFTIGAMVPGGQCRIPHVSNGVNVPGIVGATEWATSFGFDNSAAGLLNVRDVWTDDGINAYFAWSQPAVQSPVDGTAPTISSRVVANATPTVVAVTFSEAMNTSAAPAASAFSVSGHTVSSVDFASATVLNITVTPAFVNGEAARTLSYTQPGTNNLRDVAGNLLANVTGAAITNNVLPTDVTAPTLSSAAVNGASLVLTYNEALTTSPLPATSAFSVIGAGGVTQAPSAVAISGAAVTLTLATPAVSGNTVTLDYTVPGSNPIRDAAGNSAAALTGQAVTNSTTAAAVALVLTPLTTLTDNTDGTYTGGAGSGFNNFGRGGDLTMAADGIVWIGHEAASGGGAILGLDKADACNYVSTSDANVPDWYLQISTSSGNLFRGSNTLTSTLIGALPSPGPNTWIGLRVTGSTVEVVETTDAAVTITTRYTFANARGAGPLYVSAATVTGNVIYNPRQSGMA